MPYMIDWLIPDRLIYIRQYGILLREELLEHVDVSMKMRDEANVRNGEGGYLISTITDGRDLQKNEVQLKDVQGMLKTLRQQRVGWSLYVTPSRIDRFIVSVAHQMVGVRHAVFATMPEAFEFYEKVDESAPSLRLADIDKIIASKMLAKGMDP